MTHLDRIDPEYLLLLSRSEELLHTIKQKRESGLTNWQELHQLNNELSQMLDYIQAKLVNAHSPQNTSVSNTATAFPKFTDLQR